MKIDECSLPEVQLLSSIIADELKDEEDPKLKEIVKKES